MTSAKDYNIDIQRIYFLDEVHRSYNPNGSFLANLTQSDPNSIKIGLTGTPLLGEEYSSRDLFGDYIHKYYYNQSIADGYTLRLIREDIESRYKNKLQEALEEVKVLIGSIGRKELYSHPKFVEPLLNYIVKDLNKSRKTFNDDSIGGMVICDSSDQAREMNKIFSSKHTNNTAQLILHDEGSKDEIDDWVDKFKSGEIDLLFVYNMLLTGFDAHRLKKLYLGRVVRSHNLLQALTRVNRPYNEFQYGYVVDFADISEEFDATNKRYFDELQNELGDELDSYDTLFKSPDEIEREIEEIKDVLFVYNTENAEEFSRQIGEIEDREVIIGLKKALLNAKSLYNVIRLQGSYEFIESLDFEKLNILLKETSNHLDLINLRISLANSTDSSNLLNIALENVIFNFIKVDEAELVLADEYRNILSLTREEMRRNFDQADPVFTTLYEELRRLFKMKDLKDVTHPEMKENIKTLDKMHERAKEINRKNALLHSRYKEDEKYVRIHKRLLENKDFSFNERELMDKLSSLKSNTDDQVLSNSQILENEAYFKRLVQPLVVKEFKEEDTKLNSEDLNYVNNLLINEYTKDLNQSSLISL